MAIRAVGADDAPGEVLEGNTRYQLVLIERRDDGRSASRGCALTRALTRALVAETKVLHQERGDDGEGDGDEREHKTVVDGVREAHPGGVHDLVHELLPTGEGGSDAVQRVACLVADQRVRVLE